jgi:hypothetical protein
LNSSERESVLTGLPPLVAKQVKWCSVTGQARLWKWEEQLHLLSVFNRGVWQRAGLEYIRRYGPTNGLLARCVLIDPALILSSIVNARDYLVRHHVLRGVTPWAEVHEPMTAALWAAAQIRVPNQFSYERESSDEFGWLLKEGTLSSDDVEVVEARLRGPIIEFAIPVDVTDRWLVFRGLSPADVGFVIDRDTFRLCAVRWSLKGPISELDQTRPTWSAELIREAEIHSRIHGSDTKLSELVARLGAVARIRVDLLAEPGRALLLRCFGSRLLAAIDDGDVSRIDRMLLEVERVESSVGKGIGPAIDFESDVVSAFSSVDELPESVRTFGVSKFDHVDRDNLILQEQWWRDIYRWDAELLDERMPHVPIGEIERRLRFALDHNAPLWKTETKVLVEGLGLQFIIDITEIKVIAVRIAERRLSLERVVEPNPTDLEFLEKFANEQ